MTEPITLDIRPRGEAARLDWRRAGRSLRALLADPEHVEYAFEVSEAIDPGRDERTLQRMLQHPEGRAVFAERPRLLDRLIDREALAQLPEGSLGRDYLAHLERWDLDPAKLVAVGAEMPRVASADPGMSWWSQRSSLAHDLWHVLTGYGADNDGESLLLVFSLAQVGGYGNLLLSIGANYEMAREHGLGWLREVWRAWRLGKRTLCLGALPFERLLGVQTQDVRRAVRIVA